MTGLVVTGSAEKHPLTNPAFRWLWLGQAISIFGSRFTLVAIPLYIHKLTGSAGHLSLSFIVQMSASLLLGLSAGAYSDRWDKRRTMLVAEIVRAFLVMLIPLSIFFQRGQSLQVGLIYLLSFVIAAGGQFFKPAKVALIPTLVHKKQLAAANALDQSTEKFMEAVGYSAAGLMIAFVGVSAAFVVDAVTFALSAVCIYMIKVNAVENAKKKSTQDSIVASIREGLQKMWSIPSLRRLLVLSFLAPVVMGATQSLTVLFVETVLQVGEAGYGFWQTAISAGIALGILIIGRLFANTHPGKLVAGGVIGFGFFQLLSIIIPVWLQRSELLSGNWLLLVAIPFVMLTAAGNGSIFLGIRMMVQSDVPSDMIGRAASAVGVIGSLAIIIGLASVTFVDRFGIVNMLIFWSLFMLTVGIGAFYIEMKAGLAKQR